MIADRSGELARLRALLRRLHDRPPSPRQLPAAQRLPFDPIETPYGVALRWTEEVRLPSAVACDIAAPPAPGTVFLDTETTGLAGGTGTYVFLVGLAEWVERRLRVTQYFLGDLGAERPLLAAVAAALTDARQLVTFNGRTFDLLLLETRYLLNRSPWWGAELPHLDLYPMARTLWRACMPDCRLTTLERSLLGLDRGDDLPGAVMPQLYFRYLRTQDAGPVSRILEHNRWDLVALAALAARAGGLLAGPHPRHDPREWLGAARWFERRDPVRSAAFYEAALAAPLPTTVHARAAWRLGRLWRRAGRPADTLTLWKPVVEQDSVAPLGLLVDLAKLYEHHARDFVSALALARAAITRVEVTGFPGTRECVLRSLDQRRRRLEARLARRSVFAG